MRNVVLIVLTCFCAAPALALELALPVACTVGVNCWIQQYADHDAGPGATDYTCGVASYDGHDGTDIRVLHTRVNVAVLAAAAGRVKAVRDGVADKLVKSDADRKAVAQTECGNGVVIAHVDGWETQYCHMSRGTIAVKSGDEVAVGHRLGLIGYSGEAAFPHVHLSLRKDGKVVDPFSSDGGADCKTADRGLWSAMAQKALPYKGTEVLQLAWAPRIYKDDEIENGKQTAFDPTAWTSLVLFAEVINLYKDDVVTVTVSFPAQKPVVNSIVMKRNRAVQRLYAGKKSSGPWPTGVYEGDVEVKRQNDVLFSRNITFELKN